MLGFFGDLVMEVVQKGFDVKATASLQEAVKGSLVSRLSKRIPKLRKVEAKLK